MTTFRVPRREIKARVLLEGGQEIEGQLFASMDGQFGEPGLLIDRLNDATEPFLPVVTDKGAVLVNTQRILMIRVTAEDTAAVFEAEGDPAGVHLHLIDGIALAGQVYIDLPPESCRLLDYLNQLTGFFAVVAPTSICVINSRYLVSASEKS
jgi:hypothetical protein